MIMLISWTVFSLETRLIVQRLQIKIKRRKNRLKVDQGWLN